MARRRLTLRGVLEPLAQEILALPEQIFAFESAGTDRAWKVIRWSMWPSDFGESQQWTSSTYPEVHHTLYTDEGANPAALKADENRAIGWSVWTSIIGKEMKCFSPLFTWNELDPDHLVTGQLFIGSAICCHSADNALETTWSYMIEMESRKVSPTENILQTLKGRGQDVVTPGP